VPCASFKAENRNCRVNGRYRGDTPRIFSGVNRIPAHKNREDTVLFFLREPILEIDGS
jgi:hypothetical protein